MTGENGTPVPAATTEPTSIFGSFFLDDTYRGLHLLTVPLTLAPIRRDAGRSTGPSQFRHPSEDGGIHFPRASKRFVSESLYLVEYCQWDGRSGRWCSPDNHTCDFMSHPLKEPVGRKQAPTANEGIPERGFVGDRLRAGIDGLKSDTGVGGPGRNQAPAS